MANHKSALKRIRRNERARVANRMHITRSRTYVRRAHAAMGGADVEASKEAVREAIIALDKAASKGVIHKNNASRRKARLMHQLAMLEAQQ